MRHMTSLFLVLACVLCAQAAPATFVIQSGKPSLVSFHSEATIESFDGSTSEVKGEITLDPAALDASARAWFEVDLLSLDTGLALRNSHMRDNHLHTDRFPSTRFEMTELLAGAGALSSGEEHVIRARGIHELHGVKVEREVEAKVTVYDSGRDTPLAMDGPVIHVVCGFDVGLAEHGIPRPEFLFMKVAETIQLEVDVWAVQP